MIKLQIAKPRISPESKTASSTLNHSTETSSNHIQSQSIKHESDLGCSDLEDAIVQDDVTKTIESSCVELASHQESSDTGLFQPEFLAEGTVDLQANTRMPLANVDQAKGNVLIQTQETATEILIKMQAKNKRISSLLRAQKLSNSNLISKLKAERVAHRQTKTKLEHSESMADQLLQQFAEVQVKADSLDKEKLEFKQYTETALEKIQSLEAVLFESIARARQAITSQE